MFFIHILFLTRIQIYRQKLNIRIKEVVDRAILREIYAGHRLKICIGCDSQVKGKIIDFATVVLILREKREVLWCQCKNQGK